MLSTIFSKLPSNIQEHASLCHSLKYMVESAWICLTTRRNCKFKKTRITKSRFLAYKKKRLILQVKFSKLSTMGIALEQHIKQLLMTRHQDLMLCVRSRLKLECNNVESCCWLISQDLKEQLIVRVTIGKEDLKELKSIRVCWH